MTTGPGRRGGHRGGRRRIRDRPHAGRLRAGFRAGPRAPDVGTGTSKANTASCTRLRCQAGSLESPLLTGAAPCCGHTPRRPASRWSAPARCSSPGPRTGGGPACDRGERPAERLPGRSAAGSRGAPLREPRLGPRALGALEIPDESIICLLDHAAAFASEAAARAPAGALARVTGVAADGDGFYRLATTRGPLRCRWVVNSAGLGSDEVDRMFGGDGFTSRRGGASSSCSTNSPAR